MMLEELDKRLLDEFQHGMPLTPTPYADMAEKLGVSEHEVIDCLASLQKRGIVSRVGPVFEHQRVGASTLAAMVVPEDRLDEVAKLVSGFSEVNHNYQREHDVNLWFVVTASSRQRVLQVLSTISESTDLKVLNLPMQENYHIDLGFPLWG